MSTYDRYVDMDGNEITLDEWAQIVGDTVHVVIAEDTLPDDRLLRTVYFGTEFPLLGIRAFGTGLFTPDGDFIVEIGCYSRKDDALGCHAIHLRQLSSLLQDPDP